MKCEVCKTDMVYIQEGSSQGCKCPDCGWSVLTTYIPPIYMDPTEYSIYVKAGAEINRENIRLAARIAGTNYIAARQLLLQDNVCILKAKAPEIKKALERLRAADIPFEVVPDFEYPL